VTAPEEPISNHFSTNVPSPARLYDYALGGKDNWAIDRETTLKILERYPEGLDAPRQNRLFLYRVVRFLAHEAGIRQFLDMGSGLPTQANVHEVARRFRPDARVAYIDNDPIVLSHGRALLAADESTAVITADMTEPERILADPQVRALIDFSRPVAVLFLSVAHFVPDEATVRRMVTTVVDAIVPGSYVAFSQMAAVDEEAAAAANELTKSLGMMFINRTPDVITTFVRGLEPVAPGLVDVKTWRPDPFQPALASVDEPLRPYLAAAGANKRTMEFGGVLRKPTQADVE
jgi:S-adenosyl methyltransferase